MLVRRSCRDTPKDEPMTNTNTPDDLPSLDEFRQKLAHVDREFADARRYLSTLCAARHLAYGARRAEAKSLKALHHCDQLGCGWASLGAAAASSRLFGGCVVRRSLPLDDLAVG